MRRRAFLLTLAAMAGARGEIAAAVDFAPVVAGRRLVFPADHGAHPDFRTEWWYATGWLALPDGSPLGFQTTFFRVRSGIGEASKSAFAPRQLLLAHAAIADPRLGRLRHEQRAARAGFGRAGFELGHSGVWIGDWRLTQEGERYRAQISAGDFSYDLALDAQGAPLLNGNQGFSVKAADTRHASYYYSRPQLAVAGSVTLSGTTRKVTGRAWLDHEWSSELMPAGAQGWDWVGLNLDDGSALMAFRMRASDAAPLWSAATFKAAGGVAQALPRGDIVFEAVRHWRSPRTGISYPVEWTLRIEQRQWRLRPLLDDQELDSRRSTGTVYWEGAVRVEENGREIGRGYLEMTGNGEKMRLQGV